MGWPGLIGCYSCINGDGTGVFIHDTLRYNDGFHVRLEPRTLLLRRAVLAAQGATNPAQAVEETLEAGRMDTGNNFHAVCQAAGAFPPAACLETDDNRDHPDGTVTIRTSLDLDVSGTELVDALFVTNHHRKRYPPSSCWRYEAMVARAEEIAAADGAMDLEDALDVMRIVEFEELTVHTIGYRPEDRTLIIRRAGPEQTPSEDKGIQVPWDVLFPW